MPAARSPRCASTGAPETRTTRRAYTKAGELEKLVDAAGNEWVSKYDAAGNLVESKDPDKGAGTMTYDAAGQVISATDARGQVLVNVYDVLGRRTELRKDSATGEKLATWTYDSVRRGQLTASTRHVSGRAYTTATTSFDAADRPVDTEITIPAGETGVQGTHKTTTTYLPDGSVASVLLPKLGDLPAETIVYEYNDLGLPHATSGAQTYVSATSYTALNEMTQLELGPKGKRAWQTVFYQEGTRRPETSIVQRELIGSLAVDQTSYHYDPAGNVKQVDNQAAGQALDRQCFGYDGLRQLTDAWTSTGNCAVTGGSIGGAAPYWNTYRHDLLGRRTSHTQRGDATGDTTTTLTYPQAGEAQPHAPKTVAVSGQMRKSSAAGEYSYDRTGNTVERPSSTGDQQYTWDAEGQLASVTVSGATTSFVNSPLNDRLLAKQPNGTTLYLPGGELRYDTASKTLKGTRYYLHGSQVVGARTAAGVSYLPADSQGTSTVSINATTLQAVKRRFDPFGIARGTTPEQWPGERGFVGGTGTSGTGLTRLGVRDYDSNTGKFITVDPVLDGSNPHHLDSYSYSYNNPATFSDPTGKMPFDEEREMLALKMRSKGRHADSQRILDSLRPYHAAKKKQQNRTYTDCGPFGDVCHPRKIRKVDDDVRTDRAAAARAYQRLLNERAKKNADEIGKNVKRFLPDGVQFSSLHDWLGETGSVSVCGAAAAGGLLALGTEVCVHFDLEGMAYSWSSKAGVEAGVGASADAVVKFNSDAADEVGGGLTVSAEASPKLVLGVGGAWKAGSELNLETGKIGLTGQVSASVGGKASLGGGYMNVGWNTGYVIKWDDPDFVNLVDSLQSCTRCR
ncbi:hypothetical protein BBK82_31300 [Lentzea guizhouensis]|uniref:RHS repeat-associated core domain-containing protein n=1 Tax=Lentzea guizhouensis TaxID=1586287 RepID=A0A1B2HQ77_9PSEU|nr:RHS repeat-associated core domain-containing protein [Lentzea guizhouensis]ANZ39867.1 hypothetical protein BBK82_31300 [Lentzea guizhouensis]